MSSSNIPKKQHYVPQTYLQKFSDEENYLHIYDIKTNQFRKQRPQSTGYGKHFYTIEHDGIKDPFIEHFLANEVDSKYVNVINKIENSKLFSDEDRLNLSTFIAFQHLRTPAQRENYNSMVTKFHKTRVQFEFLYRKNTGTLKDMDNMSKAELAELERIVDEGEYGVSVPKGHSLKFMFDFADKMISFINNQNWVIVKAPTKSRFITSDNPYCMLKVKDVAEWEGYGLINTNKFFPLTSDFLLVITGKGSKVINFKFNSSQVRTQNLLTIMQANRNLYSPNEKLLKRLVEDMRKSKG
ncbi:DUF4238 domain-containing protein [Virgibacillus sp. C22-A2]|uniref:DUF4238 domain-containing protein n=1 Tax=Virgibacillus tibetensis TaxID=3042313 RepID=A0ABU6KG43_9BACI|nr:DUF4238 domain-containing protein [Virgibacillus sp. C22-A2]